MYTQGERESGRRSCCYWHSRFLRTRGSKQRREPRVRTPFKENVHQGLLGGCCTVLGTTSSRYTAAEHFLVHASSLLSRVTCGYSLTYTHIHTHVVVAADYTAVLVVVSCDREDGREGAARPRDWLELLKVREFEAGSRCDKERSGRESYVSGEHADDGPDARQVEPAQFDVQRCQL